jgi:hypothetical protein
MIVKMTFANIASLATSAIERGMMAANVGQEEISPFGDPQSRSTSASTVVLASKEENEQISPEAVDFIESVLNQTSIPSPNIQAPVAPEKPSSAKLEPPKGKDATVTALASKEVPIGSRISDSNLSSKPQELVRSRADELRDRDDSRSRVPTKTEPCLLNEPLSRRISYHSYRPNVPDPSPRGRGGGSPEKDRNGRTPRDDSPRGRRIEQSRPISHSYRPSRSSRGNSREKDRNTRSDRDDSPRRNKNTSESLSRGIESFKSTPSISSGTNGIPVGIPSGPSNLRSVPPADPPIGPSSQRASKPPFSAPTAPTAPSQPTAPRAAIDATVKFVTRHGAPLTSVNLRSLISGLKLPHLLRLELHNAALYLRFLNKETAHRVASSYRTRGALSADEQRALDAVKASPPDYSPYVSEENLALYNGGARRRISTTSFQLEGRRPKGQFDEFVEEAKKLPGLFRIRRVTTGKPFISFDGIDRAVEGKWRLERKFRDISLRYAEENE